MRYAIATALLIIASTTGCEVPDPTAGQTLGVGYVSPEIPESRIMRAVPYGDESHQLMDIYFPENHGAGVIVYLHAGGWCCGHRGQITHTALRKVSHGWVVVSIDYKLANWPEGAPHANNTFPAQIHDVKHAIRFLKARGASLGVHSVTPLIAWGNSAGGHLAGLAATSAGVAALEPTGLPADLAAQDSRIHGAVSVAGPLDLVATNVYSGWNVLLPILLGCATPDPASCTTEELEFGSAHTYYDNQDPPVYLAYGIQDPIAPQQTGWALGLEYLNSGRRTQCLFDLVDTGPTQGHVPDNSINITALDLALQHVPVN